MDLSIPRYYQQFNLQPIPVRTDGSKAPAVISVDHWRKSPRTPQQIASAFKGNVGIGVMCGKVSGNLEVFDIEGRFEHQIELLEKIGEAIGVELLEVMPQVKTPSGGLHLYYRVDPKIDLTNKQFAYRTIEKDGKRRRQVHIESRCSGHVVAPGSPPSCHASGMTYNYVTGSGQFHSIPVLTAEQRETIHEVARGYNEVKKTTLLRQSGGIPNSNTPDVSAKCFAFADDPTSLDSLIHKFNCETEWEDILEPHDWTYISNNLWRREGKNHGVSASTQTESSCGNFKILTVFSTTSDLFDDSQDKDFTTLDPFQAYYALNLNNDRNEGCRFLRQYYAEYCKSIRGERSPTKGRRSFEVKQELIDSVIKPVKLNENLYQ